MGQARLALVLVVGLVALPSQGTAQEGPRRGGPGPGVGAAAMALQHVEDLALDEAQVATLTEIRAEALEATEGLRERIREAREQGDRRSMRPLRGELRDALEPYDERAHAVLTDEQRERLAELVPRRGRRGGPGGVLR